MSDNLTFNAELKRLATFNNPNWKPAPGRPSSCLLARIGFYHCSSQDAVTCFVCHVVIESNDLGLDPKQKHKHRSPRCSMACGNTDDDIPLVQPVEVIEKFKNDPSLMDSPHMSSDGNQCISISSFINLFQLLKTLLDRMSGIVEIDAASIQVDLENPNFNHLRHEIVRLNTFASWPVLALAEPAALARAGLFYSGNNDRVQCAFCRGFLRNWVRGDVPEVEHRRHFPDCPFVRGVDVGNVPIADDMQPTARADAAQIRAPSSVGALRSQNESTPPSQPAVLPVASRPKHPEYVSEAVRVKSFEGKTVPRGQDTKVLASAGFYHVGPHDNVKCFHCDGGLKNWQPTDDPWEEHAKWFPRCAYLMSQRDPDYIHLIQDVYRPHLLMQPNLPANIGAGGTPLGLPTDAGAATGAAAAAPAAAANRFVFEPREIKARMDSPSVKAVLNMGFPRELVRHAIHVKLSTTGDDFSSAQELVDSVMQLQEQQEQGTLGALFSAPTSSSVSTLFPRLALPANPAASAHSSPLPKTHPPSLWMAADVVGSASAAAAAAAVASSAPDVNLTVGSAGGTTEVKNLSDDTAAKSASASTAPKSVKSKKKKQKRKQKAAQEDVEAGDLDEEKETEVKQDQVAAGAIDDQDPEARSLIEENRQLKEAKTCKVCFDEEVNIVFLPCGHLACCNNCAPALRNCPICRAFIRGTVRIFLS